MTNNNFDIFESINGDSVIGFTSAKALKNVTWADTATVGSWLMDDENSHKKHLGLIELFSQTHGVHLPFMKDLFKNNQVMELEGGQSVTYDLPVQRTVKCVTAVDTSNLYEAPGIDGGIFEIVLDTMYSNGDVLSNDPQYGEQIIVSEAHEVKREGENYRHYVKLVSNDRSTWYNPDFLKAGIEYFKVGHVLGEYSTQYSKINITNPPVGTITNEFILGNKRGVETAYTEGAARMQSSVLNQASISMDSINNQLDMMGGKKDKGMFYIAPKTSNGKVSKKGMMVGTTLEYLAMMELSKIEAHQLLFQKAGVINDVNGQKVLNEGVWHQIRRGKIIKYPKPGGITKQHIQEAASYIFKGRGDMDPMKRKIKFKVGYYAYQNILEIFREEINQQLNGLAQYLGTDSRIKSPLSGNLDALKMSPVCFKEVYLPGIGSVEIDWDPSLDYMPNADRFATGNFGEGYAHTSYSMVIWDLTDSDYSNASEKVKGAKVIEGGNKRANMYYVKPEGAHMTYGYEQGRMANGSNYHDVQSSLKTASRTFWCNSQSAALVLDTTRYLVIELQR